MLAGYSPNRRWNVFRFNDGAYSRLVDPECGAAVRACDANLASNEP